VFSVLFPGHAMDESRYVEAVLRDARHLESHVLSPTAGDLSEELPRVLWQQDEPFNDTSIFAHYRIMKLVRDEGVKVVLTGQGADEIFGGYSSYYRAFLGGLLRRGRLPALRREITLRSRVSGEPARSLAAAAAYHALPAAARNRLHERTLSRAAPWVRNPEPGAAARFVPPPAGWSSFDWYLAEALTKWSIPRLLRQDDRNSMAWSVESRAPFMDYRLVEFLFRTADGAKVGDGEAKRLLRAAGAGIVPPEITARHDKIGFYTPMADWLRGGRDLVESTFAGNFARANPYFDGAPLRERIGSLLDGSGADALSVWWAFSFTLWHDIVAGQPAATPRGLSALSRS
jgi:asparagine synthase (glutamine-hydrolysing)